MRIEINGIEVIVNSKDVFSRAYESAFWEVIDRVEQIDKKTPFRSSQELIETIKEMYHNLAEEIDKKRNKRTGGLI